MWRTSNRRQQVHQPIENNSEANSSRARPEAGKAEALLLLFPCHSCGLSTAILLWYNSVVSHSCRSGRTSSWLLPSKRPMKTVCSSRFNHCRKSRKENGFGSRCTSTPNPTGSAKRMVSLAGRVMRKRSAAWLSIRSSMFWRVHDVQSNSRQCIGVSRCQHSRVLLHAGSNLWGTMSSADGADLQVARLHCLHFDTRIGRDGPPADDP